MKRTLSLIALAIVAGLALAQQTVPSDAVKAISQKLGTLRGLADSDRAVTTKDLALQIRSLPAGKQKVQLAYSLANLSTESDCGHETMQEVATTLAKSLEESPISGQGAAQAPYIELANLAEFELVKVDLAAPQYAAALAAIDATNDARSKADFTLKDIDGKSWTLSSLKGKVVIVNFWATWCPPCRKEMPDIQALYDQLKDKGLVVLAISDEPEKTVRPFVTEHGYHYPILLDPGRKINTLFQVDGIPKSFIYNREGHLAAQAIDARSRRQFLDLLAKAGMKP